MRFETVNRGSSNNFLAGAIAFCLSDNPSLLSQVGGQRVIVVIGILQRVRQNKVGLDTAIHIRQTKQRLFIGAQRIVADIKEFDAGAQDLGGGLRLFATDLLHRLLGHVAFTPQFGGLAALAKG